MAQRNTIIDTKVGNVIVNIDTKTGDVILITPDSPLLLTNEQRNDLVSALLRY